MKLHFAGIKRKSDYSPNQITNDGLVIRKTADELKNMGGEFTLYDESEVLNNRIDEKYIFTMARGADVVSKLLELNSNGTFVINTPQATFNCYRTVMTTELPKAGIPFPKSIVVNTDTEDEMKLSIVGGKKIWIKRGDVHAVHREDVSLVYGDEELNFLLKEFSMRGIKKAVLQQHVYGDVIKFYSVKDTDFFYWYYLNGNNKYEFEIDQLKTFALKSAETLGLTIYGGDAIVSEDGTITIIDVNDWPSFAPIRDTASKYIAQKIYFEAEKFHKQQNS